MAKPKIKERSFKFEDRFRVAVGKAIRLSIRTEKGYDSVFRRCIDNTIAFFKLENNPFANALKPGDIHPSLKEIRWISNFFPIIDVSKYEDYKVARKILGVSTPIERLRTLSLTCAPYNINGLGMHTPLIITGLDLRYNDGSRKDMNTLKYHLRQSFIGCMATMVALKDKPIFEEFKVADLRYTSLLYGHNHPGLKLMSAAYALVNTHDMLDREGRRGRHKAIYKAYKTFSRSELESLFRTYNVPLHQISKVERIK